jgi:hypothetical protein
MPWRRSSTVDEIPDDPVGEAVAQALLEIVQGALVELAYAPADALTGDAGTDAEHDPSGSPLVHRADGEGPEGWSLTLSVALNPRIPVPADPDRTPLFSMLDALPGAGLRAAGRFRTRHAKDDGDLSPALRRALRDVIVVELLSHLHAIDASEVVLGRLIEETIEFLVELCGTRVEANDLTHGVVITNVLKDMPRLHFAYPVDLQSAKRGPLLFDGQRSVLIVDREGRARTELQRHRFDHLTHDKRSTVAADLADSGSLVAAATRALGGVGFFLRDDRTIWVFVDGRPLLMRRGEHWTAFPLELASSIGAMIGGGASAELVVQTAFIISAQRRGAILAIVDRPEVLDPIVSPKDRYDLRNDFDPQGARVETRLHHLIDVSELDPPTLARLATLDGATVLDRDGHLLAYGAIVATADSQHEGARTAAAKTLSESAEVVLKVSVDGDITVFNSGRTIATLLGQSSDAD